MVSWRNQLEPYYPWENQDDTGKPSEIQGLVKEQDAQDSGVDNPDSRPDCIACFYRQSLQGLGEKIKAKQHADARKDAYKAS